MSDNKEFDLDKKLEKFAKKSEELKKKMKSKIEENAKAASKRMIEVAKENTPRGRESSNPDYKSLYDSWHASFRISDSGLTVETVELTNSKPYFVYVQNGHRVSQHFVPWLYVNNIGRLDYEKDHSKKLFGLMVGTKTKYVEGIDMVGPAINAFYDYFDELNEQLLSDLEKGVF